MLFKKLLGIFLLFGIVTLKAQNIISTYAGVGITYNYGDGKEAPLAQIDRPESIAFDQNGDMYFSAHSVISKITVSTGILSTPVKGLSKLHGVAVNDGNVYFCDEATNTVKKLTVSTKEVSVVAGTSSASGNTGDGGAATSAKLFKPWGVVFDANGNMFIADAGNHNIRLVKPNGTISTIVGTGSSGTGNSTPGNAATQLLNTPQDVKVDASGNLFIASTGSNCVYKVANPASGTGTISIVAGKPGTAGDNGDGGLATAARLNSPNGLAFDAQGNLYVFTSNYYTVHRVRKIAVGGNITPYAGAIEPTTDNPGAFEGDGGPASFAKGSSPTHILNYPYGGAFDAKGVLYICDKGNSRIRKVGSAN